MAACLLDARDVRYAKLRELLVKRLRVGNRNHRVVFVGHKVRLWICSVDKVKKLVGSQRGFTHERASHAAKECGGAGFGCRSFRCGFVRCKGRLVADDRVAERDELRFIHIGSRPALRPAGAVGNVGWRAVPAEIQAPGLGSDHGARGESCQHVAARQDVKLPGVFVDIADRAVHVLQRLWHQRLLLHPVIQDKCRNPLLVKRCGDGLALDESPLPVESASRDHQSIGLRTCVVTVLSAAFRRKVQQFHTRKVPVGEPLLITVNIPDQCRAALPVGGSKLFHAVKPLYKSDCVESEL